MGLQNTCTNASKERQLRKVLELHRMIEMLVLHPRNTAISLSSSSTKQEWAAKKLEKDLQAQARTGPQIMNQRRSWKDTKAMTQAAVEATETKVGGGDADGWISV